MPDYIKLHCLMVLLLQFGDGWTAVYDSKSCFITGAHFGQVTRKMSILLHINIEKEKEKSVATT